MSSSSRYFRADGEPLVAPELDLLGLKEGELAFADQQVGDLVDRGGEGAGEAVPVEDLVELRVREQSAPANEVEELGRGCWCRHMRSVLVPVRAGSAHARPDPRNGGARIVFSGDGR